MPCLSKPRSRSRNHTHIVGGALLIRIFVVLDSAGVCVVESPIGIAACLCASPRLSATVFQKWPDLRCLTIDSDRARRSPSRCASLGICKYRTQPQPDMTGSPTRCIRELSRNAIPLRGAPVRDSVWHGDDIFTSLSVAKWRRKSLAIVPRDCNRTM